MIKKSIGIARIQENTQIVEYMWLKHQEELHFKENSTLKELIFNNFELFLLLMVLCYVFTFYLVAKFYRARNKSCNSLRKESMTSDEFSQHSRKPSCEEEQVFRHDRSSSTESSPKFIPNNQLALKQDTNLMPLCGQLLKQRSEKRVEIERDPNTNIITKIETQTVTQQVQGTEEIEEQLRNGLKQIQKSITPTQQRQVRGVRFVEESDFINGDYSNCAFVTTEWSKYCENGKFRRMYANHEFLGKGAFGEVHKAIKYLDQKLYAIKRIFFRVNQESNLREHKIFREIHALSEINHKNIVRYFTSWVEEIDNDTVKKIEELKQYVENKQQVSSNQSFMLNNDDLSYLDDMVQFVDNNNILQDNNNNNNNNTIKEKTINEPTQKSLQSFHISDYSSVAQSVMKRLQFNPNANSQLYILHIEMELCDKTLRDFIDQVDRTKDLELIHSIFVQLLQGINFMHSQKYIHRDLKPQNIFINSKNEVKIGDLGLSHGNLMGKDYGEGIEILEDDMTNNIGTPAYMAPEVHENNYDSSVDIYAIGIILFELYWKMKTSQQKYRLIQDLIKDGVLPQKMLQQFPQQSKLILKMTHKDPLQRPSALSVLTTLADNQ